MPPSDFQAKVLRLISASRSPTSHVAGGLALNLNLSRYSYDIDIFHDLKEDVSTTAHADAETLRAAGLKVEWFREFPTLYSAQVTGPEGTTALDWAFDSDFRFFPVEPDPVLGWRLHTFDLATNKAFAAAARREPRDAIDLVQLHETTYSLGVIAWAAVAKDPGFTPSLLLDFISRFARYQDVDLEVVQSNQVWTAADLSRRLTSALIEAHEFIGQMEGSPPGRVYLEDGKIVTPDPQRLTDYDYVEGTRGGVWPIASDSTAGP